MTIHRIGRLAFALCAPLLLFGCILTPGKFVSTLSINADRSFAFTYKGEVIAIDMGDEMSKSMSSGSSDSDSESIEEKDPDAEKKESLFIPTGLQDEEADKKAEAAKSKAEKEAKNRAIAAALAKEAGYKSVQYVGDGKFIIDYAIKGTLDHNFVYPYNLDAEIMFPFIAIELRANGAVRVKAPAFGNEKSGGDKSMGMGGMGGDDKASKLREGTFTLDTDAEIISQNNEDGAPVVNGRKTMVWKITPLSQAAPTAVLKMAK
jgi:hypothetical protein